ncbi:MAG: hypothetical protein AB7G87_07025 [Clostridia bacterium]
MSVLSDNGKASKEMFIELHKELEFEEFSLDDRKRGTDEQARPQVFKLRQPITREELLSTFVADKNINLNMIQYPLLSASISAYLSYMANANIIHYYFENGKLYWKATE